VFFTNCCFSQNIVKTDPVQLSIINLISSPKDYDKKRVIIKGYLSLEKENYGLYLTKDDLIYRNTKNSIFLFFSGEMLSKLYGEKMKGKYVVILGEFEIPKDERFRKAYAKFGGILNNIEYIEEVEINPK
jgi:hypothetical protein